MIPEPLSKIAEELAKKYANPGGLNYEDLRIPVSNNFKRAAEDFLAGFAAACANDKLKALHRAEAFDEAKKFVPCLPGNISEYPLNKIWHRLDHLATEERATLESK